MAISVWCARKMVITFLRDEQPLPYIDFVCVDCYSLSRLSRDKQCGFVLFPRYQRVSGGFRQLSSGMSEYSWKLPVFLLPRILRGRKHLYRYVMRVHPEWPFTLIHE